MALVHDIVLGDAAEFVLPMPDLWSILLNSYGWIKAGMKNSFAPAEKSKNDKHISWIFTEPNKKTL
jgi:hypothetical protein